MKVSAWTILALFVVPVAFAEDAPKPKSAPKPEVKAPTEPKKKQAVMLRTPTAADVSYGPHKKQVMHFWKAESEKPTPLLFYIHGGGWRGGDRTAVAELLEPMLKAKVSVVSVEYRFIEEATADKVVPPVKGPLGDAARALQFVRSKAKEWNIDKTRIAASGGSAGACSSLWLAFHPDMADERSDDPIARESTRLYCAAVRGAQTSLDPQQMKEWTPNSTYGGHAFGFEANKERGTTQFQEFLAGREKIVDWINEYSPYALVTSDDPPVYLYNNSPPNLGKDEKDPTHSANFAVKLQEKCRSAGVDCQIVYPGAPDVKFKSSAEFLIETLKK